MFLTYFRNFKLVFLLTVLPGGLLCGSAWAQDVAKLGSDFWQWRIENQPVGPDDINRVERPEGWVPDWSTNATRNRKQKLAAFKKRWQEIDPESLSISRQVDYRLIGSAIARVEWEQDILRSWRRDPTFYVQQTIGSIFEELLQPPPFDEKRSERIVRRLEQIPKTLNHGRVNLDEAVIPFARLAIAQLIQVRPRLSKMAQELDPLLSGAARSRFPQAVEIATMALEAYRNTLMARLQLGEKSRAEGGLAAFGPHSAVGRKGYEFFLKKVALLPYSPEELLEMAEKELKRSVHLQKAESDRNKELPELPLFGSIDEQIEREARDEEAIRKFLQEKELLTIPAGLGRYLNLPMPGYLDTISFLGVTDDLTSRSRLGQNAFRYIPSPSSELSYFSLASAKDTRPIIVHEGVPGHYFQMAVSWLHENPIRRHYYDSVANEGIGFYAEEMLLDQGLFSDSPRTREIIYQFMRLRALRVEVDVKLALGQMTIPEAGKYLEENVPMDALTARQEAAFFASVPGQAISYQIGKLQIIEFLKEAKTSKGKDFDLKSFHDYLWKNGNVPVSLLRWEYLGKRDQIDALN